MINLTRCSQGHYFDSAKYKLCPYCLNHGVERIYITYPTVEFLTGELAGTNCPLRDNNMLTIKTAHGYEFTVHYNKSEDSITIINMSTDNIEVNDELVPTDRGIVIRKKDSEEIFINLSKIYINIKIYWLFMEVYNG